MLSSDFDQHPSQCESLKPNVMTNSVGQKTYILEMLASQNCVTAIAFHNNEILLNFKCDDTILELNISTIVSIQTFHYFDLTLWSPVKQSI